PCQPQARRARSAGPCGPPCPRRAGVRWRLRRSRRAPDRTRRRRQHQRQGPRRDVPQAARQHGHRELPHREAGDRVMAFRSAVVTFPGSNCDRDLAVALEKVSGTPAMRVWHGDAELPERLDFIALPGGFSYGDYLRYGSMAARSPIMRAVIDAANRGVPVLGICNGFQILTESGLLPGALMRNAQITFTCRTVPLEVANSQSLFTAGYEQGQVIHVPVAHHDGNYFADEETLDRLEGEGRVAFRYLENCNGSRRDIAGVLNAAGNVLGMMPHPERAIEAAQGSTDGRKLFESVIGALVDA